jgi:hypothetical protein
MALPLSLGTVTTSALATTARPRPRITAARARQIALRKYPHARAEQKVPLENEEGKWQYAVTLREQTGGRTKMHEVMVGATSGRIEADEVTTAAQEAREKAAENRAARSGGRSASATYSRD